MDNTQKAEIPTLAALPALLPTTTTECISQHLEQLSAIPNDLIRLHTTPVGFYDAVSRVNSFPEFRTLSTFKEWTSVPLRGTRHKAGLFATWTKTWVGKKPEEWEDWYAWGTVLCGSAQGRGKHLVIWDPDGEALPAGQLRSTHLMGMQRRLVQFCQKDYNLVSVRIGGSGNTGQSRCLELTVAWLRSILKNGLELELESGFRSVRL
jgi:hypothetical protein